MLFFTYKLMPQSHTTEPGNISEADRIDNKQLAMCELFYRAMFN